ncbi:MAG: type II toxin-antitoxin system VapC family toxin [Candidatus Thermoplasmatota archaeon]|jgi:predicted nucleic acid-binding protein|nr:type II toxin-antitoxin system VapC family toxin [Candidatus Thermoplasmatota archaeon]MDP7264218.1 type II toxin-antitoxin system VapC family toxin [Candidatus Thermoplasmatota archaeon]
MGWIEELSGKIVGLDTAPLIYFIEEHDSYFPTLQPFFESLAKGEFQAVTSTLTLLEVLVHPYRLGNYELAEKYREVLLLSENIIMNSLTIEVSDMAARIRGKFNIRTPDAIQIATSLCSGVTTFITNDKGLKSVTEIDIIILDEIIG